MTQSTRKSNAADPLIAVRLPEDLRDAVREVAEANERNMSAEVRVALREHVEREKATA